MVAVSLGGFLLQQRAYTNPSRFAAEMAAESIGARKPSSASPDPAGFEIPAADEFLFARVESLVAFPVVLTSESLGTYGTHEGALVCVRAQVGSQVVGAGESLRAERALEGGGVFLNPLITRVRTRSSRHCQPEKVIPIWWNRVR